MKRIPYLYTALFLLLTYGCSEDKTENSERPAQVTVRETQAIPYTGADERSYRFISAPYTETDLSFRVSGQVTVFDRKAGDYFRKGETIAQIDDRDFIIRKDRAHAQYIHAQSEFNRIENLYAKNSISGSIYEKSKAELAYAKAAYEIACNELEDTQLKAPFDGYIQSVYIQTFQDVGASQKIVSFIEMDKLKLETYIPENTARMLLDGKQGKRTELEITFENDTAVYRSSDWTISRSATDNNLSYLMTVTVPNPGCKLPGGMSGTITVTDGKGSTAHDTCLAVPQNTICRNGVYGEFIWQIDSTSRVKPVPVKVAAIKNDMAVIETALEPGARIASGNLYLLSENDKVNTI